MGKYGGTEQVLESALLYVKIDDTDLVAINTSTKVTCHNFDDVVRQWYWVWGDMTSITV